MAGSGAGKRVECRYYSRRPGAFPARVGGRPVPRIRAAALPARCTAGAPPPGKSRMQAASRP